MANFEFVRPSADLQSLLKRTKETAHIGSEIVRQEVEYRRLIRGVRKGFSMPTGIVLKYCISDMNRGYDFAVYSFNGNDSDLTTRDKESIDVVEEFFASRIATNPATHETFLIHGGSLVPYRGNDTELLHPVRLLPANP